jgi:hypothetical protein
MTTMCRWDRSTHLLMDAAGKHQLIIPIDLPPWNRLPSLLFLSSILLTSSFRICTARHFTTLTPVWLRSSALPIWHGTLSGYPRLPLAFAQNIQGALQAFVKSIQ